MRHEQDIPSKPTFKEWLEMKPEDRYFDVLSEESRLRGVDYEKGKPETDSFTDTTITYGEND